MWRRCAVLGVLAVVGCAHRTAPVAEPGSPDQPVAASEPRDTVAFLLDLEPGTQCEEEFDLRLYENRAVDLIQWDDATGECHDRRVLVRYLPRRIQEGELVSEIERNAVKASALPETDEWVKERSEQ